MKILMVCLGNICRSPMAEGIMQAKIEKYKLESTVDSAGFEPFHTGDLPDYRAIKAMNHHGIDISGQRSRLFQKSDFDTFDRIYVMDKSNYNNVSSMAKNREDMQKVDFILNNLEPGKNNPVPDPYYGGDAGFENVYRLLDSAIEQIAVNLKKGER